MDKTNVLEVMDRYGKLFLPNQGCDGKDMRAARYAVAELIEVLKEARDTYLPKPSGRVSTRKHRYNIAFNERVAAALARISP